jgi:hypothetical protein
MSSAAVAQEVCAAVSENRRASHRGFRTRNPLCETRGAAVSENRGASHRGFRTRNPLLYFIGHKFLIRPCAHPCATLRRFLAPFPCTILRPGGPGARGRHKSYQILCLAIGPAPGDWNDTNGKTQIILDFVSRGRPAPGALERHKGEDTNHVTFCVLRSGRARWAREVRPTGRWRPADGGRTA